MQYLKTNAPAIVSSLSSAMHRALELAAQGQKGSIPKKASAELRSLARKQKRTLESQGLVERIVVRLRDSVYGDRKVSLDYYPDPENEGSVLIRLTPLSALNTAKRPAVGQAGTAPAAAVQRLSSSQAAELLNVSRPYVTKLCDEGKFAGVEVTRGKHRRIPYTEVVRVREEMQGARRQALGDMMELSGPARGKELLRAKVAKPTKTVGLVWTKRKPA